MLLLAMGSGRVERVERLIQIALRRRMGLRALLAMYDNAAEKLYRPRNYTDRDELRALLQPSIQSESEPSSLP